MKIKKINLDNHNKLIIRSKQESFSSRFGKRIYYKFIDDVLLKTDKQLLCIGICFSDSYTGEREFIKYTPQCILFFRGNSILKSYCIQRVFDLNTMQSLLLNKDEIFEKYNIMLSDEIKESDEFKDSGVYKKFIRSKH